MTAPSIKQALKMASARKPSCRVRLLFPIDPEAYLIEQMTSLQME
jgi:hypothetical protein